MLGRIHSWWQKLREMHDRNGATETARWLGRLFVRKVLRIEVTVVVYLDPKDFRVSMEADPQFAFRFLTGEEVRAFSRDEELGLSPRFAKRIEEGRDFCYAALAGERVAAYGWYALDAIEAEHNFGTAMSFPPHLAYMYKGFTHEDFRGQRLHAVGMGQALLALGDRGVSQLISTVDWTNAASLKSCYRLGYQDVGRMYLANWGPLSWSASHIRADIQGVAFGKAALKREPATTLRPVDEPVESATAPHP